MKKKSAISFCWLSVVLGLVLFAGCGKKDTMETPSAAPAAATPAAAATPIDPATAAAVSGTVRFDGAAPKAAKIDMSQDPACKGTNVAENVIVAGSDLANVFV
jgi:predicted small lipoprotein YifL